MSDKINIDEHIKEKLDGFSVEPPPHVWNGLQEKMVAHKRKRRLTYARWISAAAVVVFAFIAGWYLNGESDGQSPQLVEQQVEKEPVHKPAATTPQVTDTRNATIEPKQKPQNVKWEEPTRVRSTNSVSKELGIENSLVASIERVSYQMLESLEAYILKEENNTTLAERTKHAETDKETELSSEEAYRVAENIRNYKRPETNEKGWILGAHVSPAYSSQTTSHSDEYARNMSYSADNGTSNIGGGVSVQYKTSKRLRFESGVYYAQNGQSSANHANRHLSIGRSKDYSFAAPESVGADQPTFSNTVALSSEGLAMNSTAGVIKLRNTPEGASVARSAEFVHSGNTAILSTNGEFSQEFEFVEVPLYLRYNVLDKRLGIELIGGVNAGFVVGNNAYISNEYGKQNIGSTEDISTLNLSGTVGVGMNYNLGKHFSLAVEPRLNYYLSSINTNPEVEYRPYRIGIYTGVYYEF